MLYGIQLDEHPLSELRAMANHPQEKYVVFHPMVPLGSKPCQWPGSCKVQIIKMDGTVVGAIRLYDNSVRFENC